MYNFSAATTNESFVFGAARPGYARAQVQAWIEFMQSQQISRVCCLLSEPQLDRYSDLLNVYRQHFGSDAICWAPIADFQVVDRQVLLHQILPFLSRADRQSARVVVHCGGGIGRTGQILAAWLIAGRGYSRELAIATVKQSGRNPYEAVIVAPFLWRNPWRLMASINTLIDECSRIDLLDRSTIID
ncbi:MULTISPECIES: dual specificity protein phosphatase family protein [unclassified Chamaesiphon]|uniref:protein-tyrosine phosphatase family protein n=1 Tax=unclassified Chamaesiphon TaxID=2620921 RepID=UPI00286C6DEE|nr:MULTISPECIES: dual specificity protein phosphatase family protein [unclassified Chamaesiphon]